LTASKRVVQNLPFGLLHQFWPRRPLFRRQTLLKHPFASGCYELLADGRLSGWLIDQNGGPASGFIKVNGSIAGSVKPAWRWRVWPWSRHGAPRLGQFRTRLRLDPGDHVEVLHGLTGQPVPQVVRKGPGPGWRPSVALPSPVKQETDYLLEWMAYHRALGVTAFVLGDNGGSDHTSELLQALDEAGLALRLDWRGEVAFQERFDIAAIERICGLVDVCAIVDVDEFLRPLGAAMIFRPRSRRYSPVRRFPRPRSTGSFTAAVAASNRARDWCWRDSPSGRRMITSFIAW
jgi:hypothetical protein